MISVSVQEPAIYTSTGCRQADEEMWNVMKHDIKDNMEKCANQYAMFHLMKIDTFFYPKKQCPCYVKRRVTARLVMKNTFINNPVNCRIFNKTPLLIVFI